MELQSLLKVSGYPKLAQYLSKPSDTEHTGSLFNVFRECSRNLLYLEAEMFELIEQQNDFDREDLRGDRENKRYARSWRLLVHSRDLKHKQRVKNIKKIGRVLREYREPHFHIERIPSIESNSKRMTDEALILEQSVIRLPRPPLEVANGLKFGPMASIERMVWELHNLQVMEGNAWIIPRTSFC